MRFFLMSQRSLNQHGVIDKKKLWLWSSIKKNISVVDVTLTSVIKEQMYDVSKIRKSENMSHTNNTFLTNQLTVNPHTQKIETEDTLLKFSGVFIKSNLSWPFIKERSDSITTVI